MVEIRDVPVEIDGALRSVSLRVCAAKEVAPDFVLVIFEEGEPNSSELAVGKRATEGNLMRDLEEEIDRLKAQFHASMEQHEASDEETKAANEELQAMNEELRAASDPLVKPVFPQKLNTLLQEATTELKKKD